MLENVNLKIDPELYKPRKSMRCHYFYQDGEKFWMPGCMRALYTPDGECACRDEEKERQKAWKENDPEYRARLENKELWKENARLHGLIKKLKRRLEKTLKPD